MPLQHTPPLTSIKENPPNETKPPDPSSIPSLRETIDQQTTTTDVKNPIIDKNEKIETSSPSLMSKMKKKLNGKKSPSIPDILVKFEEEENFLTKEGILPLFSPWSNEVSHYLTLKNEDMDRIAKTAPFSEIQLNTSGYMAENSEPDETFLFFFNQLWSSKHQLSFPLFEIVREYKQMAITEILESLKKFSHNLKMYQTSFFLYKYQSFRFNRYNIYQILDKITSESLLSQGKLFKFVTSFFHFLFLATAKNDPDFSIDHIEMAVFKEIAEVVKEYLGISDEVFRSWFQEADFSQTREFINILDIFHLYSTALTHPFLDIQKLKLRTIDQVFDTDLEFSFSFFIDEPDQFSDSEDLEYSEFSTKRLVPTPSF